MRGIYPQTMNGLLGAVIFLLLALGACQDVQPTAGNQAAAPSAAPSGRMNPDAAADTQGEGELNVRLEAVGQPRPVASVRTRDPFRFGQAVRDSEMDRGVPVVPGWGPAEPLSSPTTPVPPRSEIRMIGLVEGEDTIGRVAVLTDRGQVFHGRAGDVVEGSWALHNGVWSVNTSAGGCATELRVNQSAAGVQHILEGYLG